MNKRLLCCFFVLLAAFLMTGIYQADEFEPTEPMDRAVDPQKGDFGFNSAPEITPGVFYYITPIDSYNQANYIFGYLKFIATEDGPFSIYFRSMSDKSSRYSIRDQYDNVIEKIETNGRNPFILNIELKRGTYYIKSDDHYGIWFQYTGGAFAVCTPSIHAGDLSEEVIVQEPTCTEPGYKAQRCLLCGAEVNRTEIPPLGEHTPGEQVVTQEPTCTEPGEITTYCAVCGEIIGTEIIPAHGHTPGEEEVLAEPTCLSEGVKAVKCQECGQILSRETLPIAVHKPGQFIQVLAPTCTTAGRNEQHCEVCNALLASEDTEPYGHVPGAWEDLVPVTATTDGLRVQRCVICGETLNSETVSAPNAGGN